MDTLRQSYGKIVAVTSDGASAIRKFFHMHFKLTYDDELNADTDVAYRTINFLVKINISISFLTHHIYLKLHVIV